MQNVMHRQTKRVPAPPTRRIVWVDGGHHADVEGGGGEGAGNAGGGAGCIGATASCWRCVGASLRKFCLRRKERAEVSLQAYCPLLSAWVTQHAKTRSALSKGYHHRRRLSARL